MLNNMSKALSRFISPTGRIKSSLFPRPGMVKLDHRESVVNLASKVLLEALDEMDRRAVTAWTVWQGPQDGQSIPHS